MPSSEVLMQLILIGGITLALLVMVHMTRDTTDKFHLKDLISTDGVLDEKKFTRFGAWFISSWGFVYIIISNPASLPEWYFIGYMAAWVANVAMELMNSNKKIGE